MEILVERFDVGIDRVDVGRRVSLRAQASLKNDDRTTQTLKRTSKAYFFASDRR